MLKAVAEFFVLPSSLITAVAIVAAIVFVFFKRRRLGVVLLAVALAGYLVFGNGVVAFWLMRPLEYRHAAAQELAPSGQVAAIVVLTGYARFDARIPITGQMNSASAFRVLEAARLFRRHPRADVIVSGSEGASTIMRDMLVQLGVTANRVSVEASSKTTHDSAVNLQERLAGVPFLLVTSAGHMPRAMAVFERQGVYPIPAPTDYLSSSDLKDAGVLPSGQHLFISDLAVHEYVGLLWYRLLGRI